MIRYELTEEQRRRCREIYAHIQSLGVEPGTPEDGVKWWNWPKYYEYTGPVYNAETHKIIEPRGISLLDR